MRSVYIMRRMKFVPIEVDSETAERLFSGESYMFSECEPCFNRPCLFKSKGFHPVVETTDGKAFIFNAKFFFEFLDDVGFYPLSSKQVRAFDAIAQYMTKEQKALVLKSKEVRNLKLFALRMQKFFRRQGVTNKVKKLLLP